MLKKRTQIPDTLLQYSEHVTSNMHGMWLLKNVYAEASVHQRPNKTTSQNFNIVIINVNY